MARNTVLKAHETAQKRLFLTPEQRHVAAAFTAAQRRKNPDHQHFMKIMPRRIAPTRLLNTLEYMTKVFHRSNPPIRPKIESLNRKQQSSYINVQKRFPCGFAACTLMPSQLARKLASWVDTGMTKVSVSIHNPDDRVERRLYTCAVDNGRAMELEAWLILRATVGLKHGFP